jgi:hypothetical protein
LNRRRGSGAEFERDTGLDVRDPKTIPDQVRWVARYLRRHYDKNPNYSPYPNWQGYSRPRDADPRWGDSGYKPEKDAAQNPPFPSGWRERAGGSAFDAARGAGVFGPSGPTTLKGSASLDVRIRGGNADVRTTADGMFEKVNVNRSRAVGEE